MKNRFREYHQFTKTDFEELWKNCLFVFDTNTLLNMYRYSRKTVDIYFDVLKKLKNQKQLWIPYQVWYEFYENRISVISENEKSYDKILEILENAKCEIKNNFKDHPFLDIEEISNKIKTWLQKAENEVKKGKKMHPKWLEHDDVLESINNMFDKNIGESYDEDRLMQIIKEGEKRYANNIPPWYKDKKKSEDKKYWDLILWYQIIDKAKKIKKPIVFISWDVKEDWWLQKDGKRIMPLPQLKKEMYEKANVDFHIYTPERFLELSDSKITKNTITEIRKIREIEERKIMERRGKIQNKFEYFDNYWEYKFTFDIIEEIERELYNLDISSKYTKELEFFLKRLKMIKSKLKMSRFQESYYKIFQKEIKSLKYILDTILETEELNPESIIKISYLQSKIDNIDSKYYFYKLWMND